jgi:ABC-type polar amino acid transport system ATPase subunit
MPTMIVVSHEIGFARAVADRMVFMSDGEVVEVGTPDHFLKNPKRSGQGSSSPRACSSHPRRHRRGRAEPG